MSSTKNTVDWYLCAAYKYINKKSAMAISKLIILLLTFYISCISAKELENEMNGKIPAAWVWEISSGSRLLYLVGEIHAFTGVTEKDVDFQLGVEIYDRASIVFHEARQFKNNPVTAENKISKKVGERTWRNISEKLEHFVSLSKYTAEKKALTLKNLLEELDGQSVVVVESNIRHFSYLAYILTQKNPSNVVPGLTLRLSKIDDSKGSSKKMFPIEHESISEEVWVQYCSTNALYEEYLETALSLFDFDIFWNSEKAKKLQDAFKDTHSSGAAFMNYWLDNYPGSRVLLKCNILPRNTVWKKKILGLLDETGAPVAIYVGVGHLLGSNGLIENLKHNKTLIIKRIYSLDNSK